MLYRPDRLDRGSGSDEGILRHAFRFLLELRQAGLDDTELHKLRVDRWFRWFR